MSDALNVLVLDVDVDLAESLADILELEGHSVTMVHDGPSAIEAFKKEDFDIGFFGLSVEDQAMIRDLEAFSVEIGKLIVVTLGAAGSIAFHDGQRYEQTAIPVPAVVDTTGAGDAFAAAFLSRYCYRGGIADALAAGANLAARVVQIHGTGFTPLAHD